MCTSIEGTNRGEHERDVQVDLQCPATKAPGRLRTKTTLHTFPEIRNLIHGLPLAAGALHTAAVPLGAFTCREHAAPPGEHGWSKNGAMHASDLVKRHGSLCRTS